VVLMFAGLAGGCGGHSQPSPIAPGALLSDFDSTAAGSQLSYSTVLVTSGQGMRRFVRPSWPRHLGVEVSCRDGRSATVELDGRFFVKVYCGPGQAGGNRMTVRRASALTVSATKGTRWSLVVAAGRR
jgi:hypothetical protein